MTNIGVITFHRSLNYGSVLQTYALQKCLKNSSRDYEVEVIDFYPPDIQSVRSIFIPIHSFKNLAHNMLALMYYPIFTKRKKAFNDFLNNNIKLSNRKYNSDIGLKELDNYYDVLIAGSDQIWNNRAIDFSLSYFFPTISSVKKIAYAPSLGNAVYTLPKDQNIYDALLDFNSISVRELSSAKVIKNFIGKDVAVVLDPTLLLSMKDYECIENGFIQPKKKYIFLYSVNMDIRTIHIAKEISERVKLPIISIYTTNGSFRAIQNGIKLNMHAAPGDFLSLIHNAELIISDSFHGTAFSINYHKKFYCVCDKNIDKRDPRLETLLCRLELKNRMLFFDDYLRENYLEIFDYSKAEQRLDDLRVESMDFLKQALQ